MKFTQYILENLRKGDLYIINQRNSNELNMMAQYLLNKPNCTREDIDNMNNIIRICNILYNNTDLDPLPIEDGLYDLLLEKYKTFDRNFQVGAEVIYFPPTKNRKYRISALTQLENGRMPALSYMEPIEEEPVKKKEQMEALNRIPEEEFRYLQSMYYREELLDRGNIYYIDDRDINVRRDVEITGKKYRTISHNNPELVGTLDKCKYVYNKQAQKQGVFDDPNVKILERDFFAPHFRMGLVDNNTEFHMVAELKYDGISVVVIIENGEVVHAYSRGDTGMDKATDYTPIFRGYRFPRLPMGHQRLEVKCEAIITYTNLYYFNQVRGVDYKNCRSAINGLLGSNDATMYRDLITLVPLKISSEGLDNLDRVTEIQFINQYLYTGEFLRSAYISGDFPTVLYKINMFVEEAAASRPYANFMYDGVVVSYVDDYMIKSLGRENFINKYSMAIKFNALRKLTTLLYVDFTIGQDGTITPMAHYNPVEFLGTIHTKATLSSLGRFMKMDLHEGDTIEIEYTNDVIPYVRSIGKHNAGSKPIEFPTRCPSCGTPLVISTSGESAKCPNLDCPERNIKRMANMMDKLGIKDFGEELMRSINIRSLSKLLHVTKEEISHIGDVNSDKFIEAMKDLSTKDINDYVVVGALGFTGISKETWKKILKEYTITELLDIYNNDRNKLRNNLISIKGIGDNIANTILIELEHFYIDFVEISLMKNVKSTKGLSVKKVRFTGIRDHEFMKYLNDNGYDAGEGSVTKDTSILIIPNTEFSSSKTKKAEQYGVTIMTIEDAKEMAGYDISN